ncbi:MAG: redoxin domain-containing protein [Planctomycetaceae bacterium]|nr:redoxin domain-containing protein [Planctomycetaceae bacterium]
MTRLKRLALPGLLLMMLGVVTTGGEPSPRLTSLFADPAWTLVDIEGQSHRPWEDSTVKAAVLVFISTDCPIANYYHPTLRKLQEEFAGQGITWYFVHADPGLTEERARKHAADYSLKAPVLLDREHRLARAATATKTPQAAVIRPGGAVAYLGRIDDTYVGYGKKRARPTRLDLRDALAAVAAGQPVTTPRTESVGCFIPFSRQR